MSLEKVFKKMLDWMRNTFACRRLALLGGTTTWSDCLVALRYLIYPHKLIQGPSIDKFEEAFAEKIGVNHAYSFCAGRVGLYGLLRTLGVAPGDEVIVQVPTHIVVANAIRFSGAKPIYVDCNLENYNIDLEKVEERITSKTKVLILQHTFGVPVNIDRATELAEHHNLYIIEDCVHALGAEYNGRQIGSFGKAAFFSTEETKTISTTMGGVVVTNDSELAAKIKSFQDHCVWPSKWLTIKYLIKFIFYQFMTEPHVHRYTRALYEFIGNRHPLPKPTSSEEIKGLRPSNYEGRLSNAQAELGLRQLNRLEINIKHRREIVEIYQKKLSQKGYETLPKILPNAKAAHVRYPIWVMDRDKAIKSLSPYVVPGTWFTSVLEESLSPAYGDYENGTCPRAEAASKHLINLPTHQRVKRKDAELFAMIIANFSFGNKSFDSNLELAGDID